MGRMSAAKKGDRTYASGGHTLKQMLLIREEILTKIKQRAWKGFYFPKSFSERTL
jgi:hypothetical protein